MGRLVSEAPPAPISIAEAKAFLRIATSEEDALLAGLLRSAGEMCEGFTGRMLVERPVEETLAASTGWTRLGAAPVRSIQGVAAIAADGTAVALSPEDYAIDIDASGDGWVRVTGPSALPQGPGQAPKRIRVSYRAGLAADPNGVPETLRQGIVRLAAHLYAHREREEAAGPPAAVTALWRPWRRLRLG